MDIGLVIVIISLVSNVILLINKTVSVTTGRSVYSRIKGKLKRKTSPPLLIDTLPKIEEECHHVNKLLDITEQVLDLVQISKG